ncbi:LnmK family bifunctional acyltransferase/decarboxylase [Streptomyces sp. NPDC052036]|uniref:LnmK family bifunctional acyltransferase/decarboxylase n=1 Tax=unclassified Streptomyces TaxID=2593676 RepID=UPI003439A9AE
MNDRIQHIAPAVLQRHVTVQPGMCGPTQAIIGRIGDWTWQSVSDACGLDVSNARDAKGRPAYLSFYYFRLTSSGDFHPKQLTFGDRLEVQTRVFGAGRRSVLTIHRLRRVADFSEPLATEPFDLEEAYTRPRDDSIYVENLNLWVTRGGDHTNVGLMRSVPLGFDHTLLPPFPEAHSPRMLCKGARQDEEFFDPDTGYWPLLAPELVVDHTVDVTHDVNGVGLLYFASFFSIAERAMLKQWSSLGRSGKSFIKRTIRDARICYLGNADLDARLRVRLRTVHNPDDPMEEKTNLVIRDITTDRTIAVGSFRHRYAHERDLNGRQRHSGVAAGTVRSSGLTRFS